MPQTWINALENYYYHVELSNYEKANDFPGFFEWNIEGDRDSTILFENHFCESASNNLAASFEVIFWKLYSQSNIRQKSTSRIVDFVLQKEITSIDLWGAVQQFVKIQNTSNLKRIRDLLGIKTDVLAVALTLPALASPKTIPMIDNRVAKWVNQNGVNHSINRINQLTPFKMNSTSLRQNDFSNYLNWVMWCQEMAQKLTKLTNIDWRARDVEMAVFTAHRNNLVLNVLS